jgi:hypothetical protein
VSLQSRSASFSLRSPPVPEWKSATPLDWTCCHHWPILPHLASQVARPHTVRLLSLGVCQWRRLRTTNAKWSSRIETAHHRRCGNHKQGHAGLLHYKYVKVLPSFWIALYIATVQVFSRCYWPPDCARLYGSSGRCMSEGYNEKDDVLQLTLKRTNLMR